MDALQLQTCTVDLQRGVVAHFDGGTTAHLSTLELSLLRYLAARPGEEVTREALHRDVWGNHGPLVGRAVDRTLSRLRKKVERDSGAPDHLITVFGRGVVFLPGRTPRPASTSPSTVLPGFLGRFVGREHLLDRLRALLAGPDRLVTLVGLPGVGLGRTMAELVRRGHAPTPVHHASAGGSLHVPPGTRLLLLDGPPVTDLADTIRHLLGSHPNLRVVQVGPPPLGLPGEVRVRVGGLPPSEGIELLRQRMAAVQQGPLATHGLRAVSEAVGGLPAALEAVATGLGTHALTSDSPELARDLALAAIGPRLRARLDHLAPDAHTFLWHLSGVRGRIDTHLLDALVPELPSGERLRLLRVATEAGLLDAVDRGCWSIHPLVRAVLLAQAGRSTEAHARHAAYFAHPDRLSAPWSVARHRLLDHIDAVVTLTDSGPIEAAVSALRSAHRVAGRLGQMPALEAPVNTLLDVIPTHHPHAAFVRTCSAWAAWYAGRPDATARAAAAVGSLTDDNTVSDLVFAWCCHGVLLHRTRQTDAAEAALRQALDHARHSTTPRDATAAHTNLANLFRDTDRLAEAAHHYAHALASARLAGSAHLEASVLFNRAGLDRKLGDRTTAMHHLEGASQLLLADDDRRRAMSALRVAARVAWECGEVGRSDKWLQQAIHLADAQDFTRARVDLAIDLASHKGALGDLAAARSLLEGAREHLRTLDHPLGEAVVLGNLGRVFLHLDDPTSALACVRAALAVHATIEAPAQRAICHGSLGDALAALDDPDGARTAWRQALEVASPLVQAFFASPLSTLTPNPEDALQLRTHAEDALPSLGDTTIRVEAICRLGDAWQAAGDTARARALLRQARRRLRTLPIRHDAAPAVRAVAALQDALTRG